MGYRSYVWSGHFFEGLLIFWLSGKFSNSSSCCSESKGYMVNIRSVDGGKREVTAVMYFLKKRICIRKSREGSGRVLNVLVS